MKPPKSGMIPTVFSALLRPVVRYFDRHSLPRYDGELTIAGLRQSVNVRWDGYAIPHVFAANEHDLFLAQGYLHAQERLWQMELGRRFLSGRMAEIFGDFALPWKELTAQFRGKSSAEFDYFVRLLGISECGPATLKPLQQPEPPPPPGLRQRRNALLQRCRKKA